MRSVPDIVRERIVGLAENMGKDVNKSALHQQIDENLKRVYQESLEEEVPDRFRLLLEELRRKQASEKPS
jgi:predicted house-cleaning noncanonical NTP pyrophosphatase (MazG superfamily)